MYAKLALRNVKRSAKDYLIYVITLILSVGLFYGFMSIASPYYNESLPVKINLEILNKAMRIAVPIVALLVVFLISYVNTYKMCIRDRISTVLPGDPPAVFHSRVFSLLLTY